jgi:hypothetical protein
MEGIDSVPCRAKVAQLLGPEPSPQTRPTVSKQQHSIAAREIDKARPTPRSAMPSASLPGSLPTSSASSPLVSPAEAKVAAYGALSSSQHERVRSLVSQEEAAATAAHRSPLAHAFFPHKDDLFTERSAPASLSRKVQLAINLSLVINIVRWRQLRFQQPCWW